MKYPLKFTVTRPGERYFTGEYDRFGNEIWATAPAVDVRVFSYAVIRTEQGLTDDQFRIVDRLEVIAPSGSLSGAATVVVDAVAWDRDGSGHSVGNNPYFNPGLDIYFFTRATDPPIGG